MLFAAAQLIAVCSCTPQVSPELRDHLLVKQPEQQRVVCEWSLSFGGWCCFIYFFLFSSVASSREESNYQTFGETWLMNQRKLSWVNIKLLYASWPETHLPMNDNGAPVLLDHQLLFSPSFIIIILYFRKGRGESERGKDMQQTASCGIKPRPLWLLHMIVSTRGAPPLKHRCEHRGSFLVQQLDFKVLHVHQSSQWRSNVQVGKKHPPWINATFHLLSL